MYVLLVVYFLSSRLCTVEVKKAICPSVFEWVYNTVHKGPVWAAAFSRDGEACMHMSRRVHMCMRVCIRMLSKCASACVCMYACACVCVCLCLSFVL